VEVQHIFLFKFTENKFKKTPIKFFLDLLGVFFILFDKKLKMSQTSKPTFFELLQQSLQDVEGGYDLLAPKFDQSPYVTPDFILQPFFERIKKEERDFKNGIDICSGTGAASLDLAKICSENFTALDLSQGMLDQCEQKINATHPSTQLSFVKGDALDMPFKNEFDIAVSFGAFGHILEKDQIKFIQQVHQVLKPGGVFYFVTTEKLPWWSWSLWKAKIFNGVIHVRNLLYSPKFIMYYLTFRLPEVKHQFEDVGFEVEILEDVNFQMHGDQVIDLMALKYFKMVKAIKR